MIHTLILIKFFWTASFLILEKNLNFELWISLAEVQFHCKIGNVSALEKLATIKLKGYATAEDTAQF